MKIQTSRFGQIEIDSKEVYTFTQGLPGFEAYKQFILIDTEDSGPFSYLQSTEWEELAFIITDPFLFYSTYEFTLPEFVKEELGIQSEGDVMVKSLVTVLGELKDATLNLMAPLIFNIKDKTGKQLILSSSPYQTKHPLIQTADHAADNVGGNTHARTDT